MMKDIMKAKEGSLKVKESEEHLDKVWYILSAHILIINVNRITHVLLFYREKMEQEMTKRY
jgi:hypothetical protein